MSDEGELAKAQAEIERLSKEVAVLRAENAHLGALLEIVARRMEGCDG